MEAADWQVIAPSERQMLGDNAGLRECLFHGKAKKIVQLLAIPILYPEVASSQESNMVMSNSSLNLNAAITKANKELNTTSDEYRHQAATLTSSLNRYFWKIGYYHVKAIYAKLYLGNWAGMLTKADEEELQEGLYKEELYFGEIYDEYCGPMSLSTLAYRRYRRLHIYADELPIPRYRPGLVLRGNHLLPEPEIIQFCRLLDRKFSLYYPEDRHWILRNLTTREYVSSKPIALKPEYIHGPVIDFLGFEHVILSRICWSLAAGDTDNERRIFRGVWAGHCFNITTLKVLEQGMKRETGWKDVGEEVAEELAKLWESEFGSNWKNDLVESKLFVGRMVLRFFS
ncbi:hypothetical protein RUND412_004114 [Rhizina undulata]